MLPWKPLAQQPLYKSPQEAIREGVLHISDLQVLAATNSRDQCNVKLTHCPLAALKEILDYSMG